MKYALTFNLADTDSKKELSLFEESLSDLTLGEKLFTAQQLSEKDDELSVLKTIILFLQSEKEIKNELIRIYNWHHKKIKSLHLLRQLKSDNKVVVLISIDFIGILGEAFTLPYLQEYFDLNNIELCKQIVKAISKIGEPTGAKIIQKALFTDNKELLILTIKTLSSWTEEVSWKIFKNLLFHPDSDVRTEAGFAISVRKIPKSSKYIFYAINKEKIKETRYSLINNIGIIPSKDSILPLLNLISYDKDQKARLVASRTLDRLQGILNQKELYKLRNHSDIKLRAEIIFRLGKFGTDNVAYKNYLKNVLVNTDNTTLIQACIQALGYISDHNDVSILTNFLTKDPLAGYNAVMALTRIWRLEDKKEILNTLAREDILPVQKQTLLKYMTRRRGFNLPANEILDVIKKITNTEQNINVRYLAIIFLEFAPSEETLNFMLNMLINSKDKFEIEAIEKTLQALCQHHLDITLSYFKSCNMRLCEHLLKYLPSNADLSYYTALAQIIFAKLGTDPSKFDDKGSCDEICRVFMSKIDVTTMFLKSLPNLVWQQTFLKKLLSKGNMDIITGIQNELINFLKIQDKEIRNLVMELLIPIKDPAALPNLIAIAEAEKGNESGIVAKNIIKYFIEEGVI